MTTPRSPGASLLTPTGGRELQNRTRALSVFQLEVTDSPSPHISLAEPRCLATSIFKRERTDVQSHHVTRRKKIRTVRTSTDVCHTHGAWVLVMQDIWILLLFSYSFLITGHPDPANFLMQNLFKPTFGEPLRA